MGGRINLIKNMLKHHKKVSVAHRDIARTTGGEEDDEAAIAQNVLLLRIDTCGHASCVGLNKKIDF